MSTARMRRMAGRLTAMVAGILIGVAVLNGTAYAPPQTKSVNVADLEEPNNVADVSADGALEVEGTVTGQVDVGNLPAVQEVTSQDDPARMAYEERRATLGALGDFFVTFPVPANTRLVITYISAEILLPTGETAVSLFLEGGSRHSFVLTPTAPHPVTGGPVFVFSGETRISVDDDFEAHVRRSKLLSGSMLFEMSVSGYLIDCSRTAPACN